MDTPDPAPAPPVPTGTTAPAPSTSTGTAPAGTSPAPPSRAEAPPRPDRATAEREYLALVRERLPSAAREGRWVLRLDHCFGRVLLDAAVGACWYDVLDRRRAAYRQLSDAQLATALDLGRRLLVEGDPLLRDLDAQSLRWRGKPPKRERAATQRGGALGPIRPAGAPRG